MFTLYLNKEILVSEECLSTRQKSNLILLNPIAMKMIGSSIGRPIVVNHQFIFHAWPDSTLGLTSVGMSTSVRMKLDVKVGEGAVIYDYDMAQVAAKEIALISR